MKFDNSYEKLQLCTKRLQFFAGPNFGVLVQFFVNSAQIVRKTAAVYLWKKPMLLSNICKYLLTFGNTGGERRLGNVVTYSKASLAIRFQHLTRSWTCSFKKLHYMLPFLFNLKLLLKTLSNFNNRIENFMTEVHLFGVL